MQKTARNIQRNGQNVMSEPLQLIGVGLRPTHYPHLETGPAIYSNWFEAISENYINSEGRPLQMLMKVREKYPVGLHGVSLSIGSDIGINSGYLETLKNLIDRVDPIIVSDHFCWTRAASGNAHDLLPMPFTTATFERVVNNIDLVQNFLGRQILLENISYYLRFKESSIEETTFIIEACRRSGCQLLLDLNNIYVNGVNHGFNPLRFIDQIPNDIVGQMHIAGPSQETGYLFDTHSTCPPAAVWHLLTYVTQKGIKAPLIVEWDQDIPEFNALESEVLRARKIILGECIENKKVAAR